MDCDITGPAQETDFSADSYASSLFLKSSRRERVQSSPGPLFESPQTSWTKELRVLGNVNHTDFTDTIFSKQAPGFSGGDGAISASRMLNVTRSLVKGFMDLVGGVNGGNEGILRGDDEVAEEFPKVVFDFNNISDPCAPDLCSLPQ